MYAIKKLTICDSINSGANIVDIYVADKASEKEYSNLHRNLFSSHTAKPYANTIFSSSFLETPN